MAERPIPRSLEFLKTAWLADLETPGQPNRVLGDDEIRTLHERGLDWQPFGNRDPSMPPAMHVVTLTEPEDLRGQLAIVELPTAQE